MITSEGGIKLKSRGRSNKKRKSVKSIIWKGLFWLVVFSFVGVCVWALFFSPLVKVRQISITNDRISNEALAQVVRGEITGNVLSFIPKDNLILAPKARVETALRENFNLIKNVKVKKVFPDTLVVEVEERESKVIWCASGSCFLVDESGEAFYKLNPTDKEFQQADLLKVNDSSQEEIKIGRKIISVQIADFCQNISRVMQEQLSLGIEKELKTPSAMSDEMRAKTKVGWEVYFNLSDPIDKQMTILRRVLEHNIKEERWNEIEYVDIRLRGKVTYKMKGEVSAEESSEKQEEEPEEKPLVPSTEEKKGDNKKKKN